MLDIPGAPGFDQLAFAHGMLVMAHSADNTLDIFDLAKRRVVTQVKGMSAPHGIAVDPKLDMIYVANSEGKNIAVVSASDWKLARTISLQAAPFELALTGDGKRLLIGNRVDRSIAAIDLGSGDKVTTQPLNGSPAGLAFDPSRQLLFASLQDTAEVAAIDANTLQMVRRFPLSSSQPTGIALNATASALFVTVRGAVLALDPASGHELGRVTAPEGADSLWLDNAAGVLFAGSGSGTVDAFRVNGNGLAAGEEIHTELRGHSLAFDPSRNLLFVAGGREGRSKLLMLKPVAKSDAVPSPIAIK